MTVHICLATYNGSAWLAPQLQSLLDQQHTDWQLLISDDLSGDDTPAQLAAYAQADPRIELLPPPACRLGACGNFERLLAALFTRDLHSDDCIALCDQDDVWRVDKLTLQIDILDNAMACSSDLALTDTQGRATGTLLLEQLRAPTMPTVAGLLAQNPVVGCTLVFRVELLELALPFPKGLVNHDWWLGLCAIALGGLRQLNAPLVNYRQHAANVVGAYRPLQQLRNPLAPLRRQRRVLQSQARAVSALEARLAERGLAIPDALAQYRELLDEAGTLIRVFKLVSGPFAAPHLPLRLVRGAAALWL